MNPRRQVPFALVVEDHPLVSESLVACFRSCDPGLEVNVAESLRAALGFLEAGVAPVLIVTDLELTDATGTEAVRRLREAAPASPLLVLTAMDDPVLRAEAGNWGALGYLVKSSPIGALKEEIRKVIGGRPRARGAPAQRADSLPRLLTPKQLEVLEELVAGRSNKQIAARLSISDETVGSHMKSILGKLAVRNRTEAVVRYLQITANESRLS